MQVMNQRGLVVTLLCELDSIERRYAYEVRVRVKVKVRVRVTLSKGYTPMRWKTSAMRLCLICLSKGEEEERDGMILTSN